MDYRCPWEGVKKSDFGEFRRYVRIVSIEVSTRLYTFHGEQVMSKLTPSTKEDVPTLLSNLSKAISQAASVTRTNNPKQSFLRTDHCVPNFLPIQDADDLNTFLNHAAKVWCVVHPIKRGRRSDEPLVFEECLHLYETGKISEKLSLDKITDALTGSLEDKKMKNRRIKILYRNTVHKHVSEWRKRTRDMISKGYGIEEMRKTLLGAKPGRPYNPWASGRSPRKKK